MIYEKVLESIEISGKHIKRIPKGCNTYKAYGPDEISPHVL